MLIIILLIGLIAAITGLIIFIKNKNEIDLKKIKIFMFFFFLVSIPDVFTTYLFTKKLGIHYEGNLLARTLMYKFGIVWGMFLAKLIAFPIIFFISMIPLYAEFKTGKPFFKAYAIAFIAIGIIICINNFLNAL